MFIVSADKASINNNNNTNDISDDECSNDGASVYSTQSESNIPAENDETAENVVEKYEEKMMQAIENASEKSQQTRCQGLQVLIDIFTHNAGIVDFVSLRQETLMDILEKALKRGKGLEQSLAANVSSLMLIILGGDEDVVKVLTPALLNVALDKSASTDARAKCCSALALLQFLGGEDIGDLIRYCQLFETIFSGSYLKASLKIYN